MRRRPERGDAHEIIAVAADRDRQPAGALERQRRADRDAGAAADAAAAVAAEIVERMAERPPGAVPGQRQMRERDVAIADRLPQAECEMFDRERAVGKLRQRARWRGGDRRLTRAAEMFEQARAPPDPDRRRGSRSTGRQALIVHAPAVMQMMVDRDLDHLGRSAFAAFSVPARSTQSRLRMTSACASASSASGTGSSVPGAPICSG